MARCADAPQNRGRISRQYRETLTRISGRNVPIPTVSELALLPWQGAIDEPLGRGVSGLLIEDAGGPAARAWAWRRGGAGPRPVPGVIAAAAMHGAIDGHAIGMREERGTSELN
jgi:hypothetical protein